jgi:hypothetical protein
MTLLTKAIIVILVLPLVPLVIYSALVYPFIMFWYMKEFGCRWTVLSIRINQKLNRRKNFSWFRSRHKKYNDIFWRLERRNINRAYKILVLAHIPLILAIILGQILAMIKK